ncbi:MAG TPA: hypothetical protein VJA21_03765 [Verrucomicrobiae bacterium]
MKTKLNHVGQGARLSLISGKDLGPIPGRRSADEVGDYRDRQDACPTVVAAFSLIEIMVAVGLLTFIILGLLAVFTQTQRAFRTSITQTDVLEGGRSLMEMMTREIEQAAPTHYPDGALVLATNFFTRLGGNLVNPLVQELPGTTTPRFNRTNIIQNFFFMTRLNQDWIGTGYWVRFDEDPSGCVGTLYRASLTNSRSGRFNVSYWMWTNTPMTMSRLAEGIVHLRVRPFAANGFPIVSENMRAAAFVRTNALLPLAGSGTFPYGVVRDAFVIPNLNAPDEIRDCYFVNSAIPASVELEIGILEPRIAQRYKSIPSGLPAAREYLSNHVAQVHLFRQRIPLRNADLSVFP